MTHKIFIIILFIIFHFELFSHPKTSISFLIGKYHPKKNHRFINIKHLGIPTKGRNLYLQKKVAYRLKQMYKDLKKEHPEISFWITSATRTYWYQKKLWNRKWNHYQKQFRFSSPLKIQQKKKIIEEILLYSAMPGTSRHHWGTDFDVNIVENEYYEKGNGKQLWEWLYKNAKKYGFCMPYNHNRKEGYQLEKWHWSYYPLASQYQKEWNYFFQKGLISNHIDFKGKEMFPQLAFIYVNSINPDCKPP